MGIEPESLYMIKEFYDEIENSKINNMSLEEKNIAKRLASFCLSEKFIPFVFGKYKFEALYIFMAIYELKEKIFLFKNYFSFIRRIKK
jgi:hypothetical protein